VTTITQLQNYSITQLPKSKSSTSKGISSIGAEEFEGKQYEGKSIGKKDLRQVQDRPPQRRGAGDLRKRETQTETRMRRNL